MDRRRTKEHSSLLCNAKPTRGSHGYSNAYTDNIHDARGATWSNACGKRYPDLNYHSCAKPHSGSHGCPNIHPHSVCHRCGYSCP